MAEGQFQRRLRSGTVTRFGHVVVIGAGMAGLLTARAVADHANRVTILERDRIPATPVPRPGVPQARHTHVLLAAGQQTLEAMLPGVLAELASLGVPAVGLPRDIVQLNGGRWMPRRRDSRDLLTGTRALLEHVVRRRTLDHSNIAMQESVEVAGLVGDAQRVRGVRLRDRGGAEELTLAADLVVDAAGRGSHTPRWLAAIGAHTPREERIDTGLAYATRLYRAEHTDSAVADYRAIYLVPHPGTTRSGVVMPIEEPEHYLVTLTGLAGDEPPTDPAGFEAFAAGLEHPFISEWIARARPAGPPMGHRRTANIRRRYDLLPGPAGLLVVGDAACAFNPVYGQGMSVAALGAAAVARALADGTPKTLQRAVIRAADDAWVISAGADKAMPGVTGNVRTGVMDRVANWYLGRLQHMLGSTHPVDDAFLDVIHLVAPARTLFAPRLARTVLFGRSGPDLPGPPLFPEA